MRRVSISTVVQTRAAASSKETIHTSSAHLVHQSGANVLLFLAGRFWLS
jgi:hypothetical protein